MTTRRARANGEGSIYPRKVNGQDAGYAAYVWVTRPNGTRARKYVYGKTREETHERWLKLHQRASEGPVASGVPTLGNYLAYWLEEIVTPNVAPLTAATYETFVRLYLVPGLGDKRLDRLQVRDVQAWINRLPRTCQCCAQGKDARRPEYRRRCCAATPRVCCKDYPSARTVKDIRGCLRSALSNAVREELVRRNVAALVKLPAARRKKRMAWSSDEARRFLESARRDGSRLYAAYVLILVLGLRKGEALGLTWDDVDLDAGQVTIGRQLQRVRRQLLHRETKTQASDAALPLPEICRTALKIRTQQQDADRKAAGEIWQPSNLVFTTRYGTPVEPRNFNRYFTARCDSAEVRRITVHDARRTCATLLVDLDVHPRVVMQILRHADFSVTMEIYSQASSTATREALKRLGESLD